MYIYIVRPSRRLRPVFAIFVLCPSVRPLIRSLMIEIEISAEMLANLTQVPWLHVTELCPCRRLGNLTQLQKLIHF